MLHAAEVPMLKSKTGWLLTAMALAVGLSLSPAAEGSELAKLGRLIVTGKRAPSADAGKAGTLPAAPVAERSKGLEPERVATPPRPLELGSVDLPEGLGEQRVHEAPMSPRGSSTQPAGETPLPRADRLGRLSQQSASYG
jgi:hypothetical protein